jgi:N utilization substance protein A
MGNTIMNLREFAKVVDQVSREKNISKERVTETIEAAIAAAYKKEYGKKSEVVIAHLDFDKNDITFEQIKEVVDPETVRIVEADEEGAEEEEDSMRLIRSVKDIAQEVEAREEAEELEGEKKPRYNPNRHILLDDARKIKKSAQPGDELSFKLETHEDFGRIAAQTAKQVIIQKLREAERESLYEEYKSKEGQLLSGIIQNFERGNIYVNLGKTNGVMFRNEGIPTERYSIGQRLRFYVLAVQEESRLPGIVLSRAHPKFVEKLFELEVPEIAEGVIEVRATAREAGSRTKIAVASNEENIDPVGSCVGQRGSRVMAVINELGSEKIDIIPWSDDPEKFIGNALSPAKVRKVEIQPKREVVVYVNEDQLSLAIGKGGQNVRLAAKLTGWKIDVRSYAEPDRPLEDGVADLSLSEDEPKPKASRKHEHEEEASEPVAPAEEFEIPGIGPKIMRFLAEAGYDTEKKLSTATMDDLLSVEGIGERTAEKIVSYFAK